MDFVSILSSSSDLGPNRHHFHHDDIFETDITSSIPLPEQSTTSGPPRPFRAITHLAVVTAFVLPFTLLPYVLTRRQLSLLRHQVEQAGARMTVIQGDLRIASSEITSIKEEHRRLRGLIHDMMQETNELKLQAEVIEAEHTRSASTMKSDLEKMLIETRQSRTHAAALRALGTSLADVAAFMHRVELDMGMLSSQGRDPRGVERLRLTALELEKFGKEEAAESKAASLRDAVIEDSCGRG